VFPDSKSVCTYIHYWNKEGLRSRPCAGKFHPTIKSVEEGLSVLSHFSSVFQPPASSEGYDRILSLKLSDHTSPLYTYEDISSILRRIRDSPPIVHKPPIASSPQRGSHGFHGGSPYGRTGRGSPSQGVWRQKPHNTNNWRTPAVVRGSASGFVGSAREQRTGTEPQWRINRTSNVPPTGVATPSRDELSGGVKDSHSSDERGKSFADAMTIT
jgi:hypothetical protein